MITLAPDQPPPAEKAPKLIPRSEKNGRLEKFLLPGKLAPMAGGSVRLPFG